MTRAARFESAYAAFRPAPDDRPEAIPFYRAFAGLRAAWGEDFCDTYNHALHQAACTCGGFPEGQRYAVALAVIKDMAERVVVPEEPRPSCSYSMPPQKPTEDDARALFVEQFRSAFPGKRANSKFGNEQWLRVRGKALELVRAQYDKDKARYDREEARLDAENQRRRQEWRDKVQQAALFVNAVRNLL